MAAAVGDQTRKSAADLIVLAQEVRDAETMSNYVNAVGVEGLKVVSVSNFRDGDIPIWQQVIVV